MRNPLRNQAFDPPGEATVDADQAGTFTAVVGEYDGSSFSPVHERDITVDAGINTIEFDMAIEPGEYLLTRDGSFPLRRGEWSDWESQSRDGLELIGGAHPEARPLWPAIIGVPLVIIWLRRYRRQLPWAVAE